MRLMSFCLLASFLVTCAEAQAPAGPQPQMVPVRRMRMMSPPPAFTGDSAQVAMDVSHASPIVEVRIAGKPYKFLVDTGAGGHGRISPELAATLGLAVTGEAVAGDGSGRTQTRRTFRIDSLELGAVRFSGLDFAEVGRLPPGVDGVLGLGLFASHTIAFDFPKAILSLSRAELPATALGYAPDPRGITLPLTIGAEHIQARIDTGNAIGQLVLPADLAERLPKQGEPRVVGLARTAISEMEIRQAEISLPVRLGDTPLSVTSITWPALDDLANLGARAFASSILRIDQRNHRVEVLPGGGEERR
jgi:predicted aspartyl protease